jgi:hypothetical protein
MLAAPRISLIVVARRLPAEVACHRGLDRGTEAVACDAARCASLVHHHRPEGQASVMLIIVFPSTKRKLGLNAQHWARYLLVVSRRRPAASRRFLIVVARRLPAAVAFHRHLAMVPRPVPAAPFLVRRRCLVVVSRPSPAAPLAVRRTIVFGTGLLDVGPFFSDIGTLF